VVTKNYFLSAGFLSLDAGHEFNNPMGYEERSFSIFFLSCFPCMNDPVALGIAFGKAIPKTSRLTEQGAPCDKI